MKYEAYSRKEIQETLDAYLTSDDTSVPLVFEYTEISKDSPEYNVDTFIKIYERQNIRKVSHKEFVKSLTKIKSCAILDKSSIQVINKLIGDRKLFNKIKICTDGSYLQNRIWGHINNDRKYIIEPDIGYELWKQFDHTYPVSINNPKKYIDWLYNNFDTIFLQISMSINEIHSELHLNLHSIHNLYDYE